ncbi:hypothetical protein KU6B_47610 [Mameliella alba]|uniref:hypothetical protein n=1 Tax=Mameliella alba TaxID=561184 RepID=UPI0013E45D1C|nr:hypothetical protein [Mameliella alba]BBU58496.1 hypothetical protein KU6B_47610 [Mameliella alba]
MTDVSTLAIAVDSSGVVKGSKDLDKLSVSAGGAEGAARGVGSAFDSMAAPLKGATTGLSAAQQRIVGMIPALDGMSASARDSALAFQEIDASKAAFDRLRMSLDPLYASSMQYAAAADAVEDALARGAVTQGQANHVLGLAEKRYLGAAAAADRLSDQAVAAQRGFTSMSAPLQQVNRGLSPKAQNDAKMFAYQLNQVAQQGAVTGNYMGALSIQAADMLAVFGLWGVLAGGVVAVMGPVAMSLFDTGQGAKDAQESVDTFLDALSAVKGHTDTAKSSMSELRAEYGDFALEVREAAKLAAQASISLAFNEFDDVAKGVRRDLDEVVAAIGDVARANEQLANVRGLAAEGILGERQITEAREALELLEDRAVKMLQAMGMSASEARALNDAMDMLAQANTMQEVATAAAAARAILSDMYGETERIPTEVSRIIENLNRMIQAASSGVSAMDGIKGGAAGAADEASRLASNILTAMQNAVALQQAMASLNVPFADAMDDLNFQLSTAGMSATDKLVATRVRALEGQMRAQSERVFGFDYGLTAEQQAQLTKYERALRDAAPTLASKTGGRGGGGTSGAEKLHNERLREAERITRGLEDATARYRRELADLTELYGLGYLSADQFRAAQEQLALEMDAERISALTQGVQGFTDALFEGGEAVAEWARRTVIEIAKVITQMLILKALGLPTDGVGGGGFAGWIGQAIFGGFRASGGPVSAGKAYIVGERGPEMIVPNAAGTVVPNDKLGRGNMTFNIDARGAEKGVGEEIAMSLRAEMRRLRADTPEIAIAAVRSDTRENPL